MKSLLKYATFALLAGILLYGLDALAQNSNAFNQAKTLLTTTFKNVRMIVYIVGAFGLVGIAVGAIMGKINFKWLAVLAMGLAIVAGADAIISYAIKNQAQDGSAGVGYTTYQLEASGTASSVR